MHYVHVWWDSRFLVEKDQDREPTVKQYLLYDETVFERGERICRHDLGARSNRSQTLKSESAIRDNMCTLLMWKAAPPVAPGAKLILPTASG